jgi:para-aminobenzoate synthetase component 1
LGSELEGIPSAALRACDPPDLFLGLYDWHWEQSDAGWQMCGTDAWRAAACLGAERRHAAGWQTGAPVPPVSSTPSEDGFKAAVARTVERIFNGELFQVNLCRRLEAALPSDAIWDFYERLRAISPAEHGALIRTGPNSAVLSVSPELFLSLRNGQVRSCPIKGTRPRGRTAEEDSGLAQELAGSEKDQAELAMIVDVTRNDLGRVSVPGSVAVMRHAELMTLPTVHHTVSEVTGRLRPGCGPADLLRASFPPASITGAPKIHAMEVTALEEGFRRGPCMGSIGWISLDGDLELSVGIRTAVAAEQTVWYLAGCGITCESIPDEELAESEAKAAAFRRALQS